MPVEMEQCEWCAREIFTYLRLYIIEQGSVSMRVCQECRHSKGDASEYRYIRHYISMCDRPGEYNARTNKRLSNMRKGWCIAVRAKELKG